MAMPTRRTAGACVLLLVAALPLLAAAEDKGLAGAATSDVRGAFEADYRSFLAGPVYRADPLGGYAGGMPGYSPETIEFMDKVAAMGPAALPLVVEKLEGLQDPQEEYQTARVLVSVLSRATRRRFVAEEWPGGEIKSSREGREKVDIYLAWWGAGQKGTTARFELLYSRWNGTSPRFLLSRHQRFYADHNKTIQTSPTDITDLGHTFDAIVSLGYAALPPMMDKLRAGDYGVLPFIAGITREEATSFDGREGLPEKRARLCLEWWDTNKERYTVPFPDVVKTCAGQQDPPTADKAATPAE